MTDLQGAGSQSCSLKRGRQAELLTRRVISSGCPRSWLGGARGCKALPRPHAPKSPRRPGGAQHQQPPPSTRGPWRPRGAALLPSRLQPTCSPRTDGQGCWGRRGARQRTEHNARLERRQAGESQVGPGPGPQGSPQIHTVTPTSAPEGGPAPNSTKPPSALASPAPMPTRPGAQQGHHRPEGTRHPAWPQPRACIRHP